VDAECAVVRDVHCLGGVPPGSHLFLADAELAGAGGVACGRVGGGTQVLLGHQVGVDVVVCDGADSSGR